MSPTINEVVKADDNSNDIKGEDPLLSSDSDFQPIEYKEYVPNHDILTNMNTFDYLFKDKNNAANSTQEFTSITKNE
jgi:hypothetical protein